MKLHVWSESTGRGVSFGKCGPAVWAIIRVLGSNPKGLKPNAIADALLDQKLILESGEVSTLLCRLWKAGVVTRQNGRYTPAVGAYVTSRCSAEGSACLQIREGRPSAALSGERGADPACTPIRNNSSCKTDWHGIDWILPDAEIARQIGMTRERVRQQRQALGMARSPLKHLPRVSIDLGLWLMKNQDRAAWLNAREINAKSGIVAGKATIAELMQRLNIEWHGRDSRPMGRVQRLTAQFNWDLGNRDLARTWGVHPVVVAKYRASLGAGTARWDGRRIDTLAGSREYLEYLTALSTERTRASGRSRLAG